METILLWMLTYLLGVMCIFVTIVVINVVKMLWED